MLQGPRLAICFGRIPRGTTPGPAAGTGVYRVRLQIESARLSNMRRSCCRNSAQSAGYAERQRDSSAESKPRQCVSPYIPTATRQRVPASSVACTRAIPLRPQGCAPDGGNAQRRTAPPGIAGLCAWRRSGSFIARAGRTDQQPRFRCAGCARGSVAGVRRGAARGQPWCGVSRGGRPGLQASAAVSWPPLAAMPAAHPPFEAHMSIG